MERMMLDAGYSKQVDVDLTENGTTVLVIFDLKDRTLSFVSSFSPSGSVLFTTVYNGAYEGMLDEAYGIPYKTIMPLKTYLEIKAFKFNPKLGKLLDVSRPFLNAMLNEVESIYVGTHFMLPKRPHNLFSDFEQLTAIEGMDKLEFEKCHDINFMFSRCPKLKRIDFYGRLTSNIIYMNGTFNGCISLREINLSRCSLKGIHSLDGTFMDCSSLTALDLSTLDEGHFNPYLGQNAFKGAVSLVNVKLPNWLKDNSKFFERSGLYQ